MRSSVRLIIKTIKHLKKILVLGLVTGSYIAYAMTPVYTVQTSTIQPIVIAVDSDPKVASSTSIESKIRLYADKYNVPYKKIYNTINCETAHTFDTKIQSQVIYNFSAPKRGIVKGEQEKSYGLAQIHLPDHPNISYSQATNADFAIEFMAKEYSKGRDIWYCD